ncbi:hypothetical protein ES703_09067 [subsurface metagenome]
MGLTIDMKHIVHGPNNATNFTTQLLRLIFKADQRNRAKLRREYPNAVMIVETYQDTGEVLELESD